MQRDEFLAGMQEAAERANERISRCHECVACPKCGAPIGKRCTRAAARGTARYAVGSAGVPLKHPHRERWTLVVPDR